MNVRFLPRAPVKADGPWEGQDSSWRVGAMPRNWLQLAATRGHDHSVGLSLHLWADAPVARDWILLQRRIGRVVGAAWAARLKPSDHLVQLGYEAGSGVTMFSPPQPRKGSPC